MEYKSGKFICPKCNTKMMNIYTDWLNRKICVNNIFETQWIFYKKIIVEENKCESTYFTKEAFELPFKPIKLVLVDYCLCCRGTIGEIFAFILNLFILIIVFSLILIFWIIYIILGLLIFIWIDFCRCLCKKIKKNIYV